MFKFQIKIHYYLDKLNIIRDNKLIEVVNNGFDIGLNRIHLPSLVILCIILLGSIRFPLEVKKMHRYIKCKTN